MAPPAAYSIHIVGRANIYKVVTTFCGTNIAKYLDGVILKKNYNAETIFGRK